MRAVRDLCRLVFLIETKLRIERLERIRVWNGFGSVFGVDSIGRSGGLAVMWREDISVEIQNYSKRHINALVSTISMVQIGCFPAFTAIRKLGNAMNLRVS